MDMAVNPIPPARPVGGKSFSPDKPPPYRLVSLRRSDCLAPSLRERVHRPGPTSQKDLFDYQETVIPQPKGIPIGFQVLNHRRDRP